MFQCYSWFIWNIYTYIYIYELCREQNEHYLIHLNHSWRHIRVSKKRFTSTIQQNEHLTKWIQRSQWIFAILSEYSWNCYYSKSVLAKILEYWQEIILLKSWILPFPRTFPRLLLKLAQNENFMQYIEFRFEC